MSRFTDDSMVSKREWRKYCDTLKQVNTDLGMLATKQHESLKQIISLTDMPSWDWMIHGRMMREALRGIVGEYRDVAVEDAKNDTEKVEATLQA